MRLRFLLISLITIGILGVSAHSGTPMGAAFTYQGRLTDSTGTPLSGSYNLSFKLFDASTGDTQIGSTVTVNGINVTGGVFTCQIDFGSGAFNGEKRWLETTVGTETLSPRTEMTGTPYAGSALRVAPDGLSTYTGSIQNLASTSANPVVVGSLATGGSTRDVVVFGRYAYVINQTTDTFKVIDVSNATSPSIVGSVATGINPISVALSGRYAYVSNHGSQTMQVIDVSNPAIPVVVGSVGTAHDPGRIAVSGRYAYIVCDDSNTLQIIDISSPSSPAVVSSFLVGSAPNGIAVSGRYVYVANSLSSNLQVIDVSNPASPSLVGTVTAASGTHSVAILGRYAYVVNITSSTMQVIDVSNPASPSVVSTLTVGGESYAIAVSGRYAYVTSGAADSLRAIDVSDPSSPVVVGSVSTADSPAGIAVSGRYAYVANILGGVLQVVDIRGIETTSLNAHSLEAGSVQVRGNAFIGEELSVRGGLNVGASGNFAGTVSANGVALTSDARFKTNVETLRDALGLVGRLRGVSFDWDRGGFPDRNFGSGRQIGFLAQEVEQVLPELVTKDSQGYEAVHYQNLVPLLVEAIKQQQKTIEKQQKQIDELRELVTDGTKSD